jgi:hypothetical protein
MKKYGVSITNLLGSAGPDKLVDAFAKGLGDESTAGCGCTSIRSAAWSTTVEWIKHKDKP